MSDLTPLPDWAGQTMAPSRTAMEAALVLASRRVRAADNELIAALGSVGESGYRLARNGLELQRLQALTNLIHAYPEARTVPPKHYPPGMGEESRRLHCEYNVLVAAQRDGAKNGADVVRLTNECATKGIVLVPGGENL